MAGISQKRPRAIRVPKKDDSSLLSGWLRVPGRRPGRRLIAEVIRELVRRETTVGSRLFRQHRRVPVLVILNHAAIHFGLPVSKVGALQGIVYYVKQERV